MATTLAIPNGGARAAGTTTPVARAPLLLQWQVEAPAPPQPRDARRDGQPVEDPAGGGGGSFPWLPTAGFAYLTFGSAMALHRYWPDPGDVAFVASAYATLLLLFWCLRRYERAQAGSSSSQREWLKLAVWLLTSALTLLFAVMPAADAAVVWLMGLATISGGFFAFFCFQKKT